MDQYGVGELRETFIEMFCTVKTAVVNPMMNPSGSGGRRACLVFDEGDLDGSFGYWDEDEEDGAEGFLDALSLGSKEDFKEEEREKEKEDQDEYFSDRETKEKEKEKGREKEKVVFLKMRAIGLMMNGKDMKQRS